MHHIHTTSGLIIGSRPTGEAGRIFSIFTRDYGLILAVAQGIRLERSKLRYHTREYSFGTFSLVRGKEFWRLTSANATLAEQHAGQERTDRELIARLSLLLKRLLHGEEAHPELFECVTSCAEFIGRSPDLTEEQAKTLESVAVLRILHALGYIGEDKELEAPLLGEAFSPELLGRAGGKRTAINQHINKALRESHL